MLNLLTELELLIHWMVTSRCSIIDARALDVVSST